VFGGLVAETDDLGAGGLGLERVWSSTAANAAGEERARAAKEAASKGAGTAILRLGVVGLKRCS